MPGEAFPASRRIRKRSDFQRIQRDGRPFRTPHYILLVLPQAGASEPSRLGVVATKKVGNAPARNRGKRLCRELFRRGGDFVPNGFDLVVILRNGADEVALDEARAEWEKARPAIHRHCEEARKRAGKASPAGQSGSATVERRAERPHVASTSQRRPRGGSTS